ncbi:hypothetical protein [Gellertiella hungarica]|uniref:BON domain-containing protein n=1 Tax=Gellertiella hungarica TaxID=1572859 RepID=A0A7W6NMP2_9HYPH|nr:hypothetical protein [Gellertiella hungarica]MBB4067193.1 hypothetical protein [Gellertiella hungarica]
MVLILPEAQPEAYCPDGATASGLLASIRTALAAECEEDVSRVSIRILGSYVIIEGLVPDDDSVTRIRTIAEDIAGAGYVRLRLFRQ